MDRICITDTIYIGTTWWMLQNLLNLDEKPKLGIEADPFIILNNFLWFCLLSSSRSSGYISLIQYFGCVFFENFLFQNLLTFLVVENNSPVAICCWTATFATHLTSPFSWLATLYKWIITLLYLSNIYWRSEKWLAGLYWEQQLPFSITMVLASGRMVLAIMLIKVILTDAWSCVHSSLIYGW